MSSYKKKRKFSIPKKQTSYKSCKPIKNIFELIMIKKLISKNVIVPCKYSHAKYYSSNEAKENIKQIKNNIIKKRIKIPPIIVVQIRGIFHVTNPMHIKMIMAIKIISYKDIEKNKIERFNVTFLMYPYISKLETIKMCMP